MHEFGWFLLGVGMQIFADGLRLDEHQSVYSGLALSILGALAGVYGGMRAGRASRRGSTKLACLSCAAPLPGLSAVLVQRCVHCGTDNELLR